MPSRLVGPNLKDNEVLKRGSVYQSSREIRRMRQLKEERRKVKLTHSDKGFISIEITDSLSYIFRNEAGKCQQEKISSYASLNSKVRSAPTNISLPIQTRSIEPADVPLLLEEHSKFKSLYQSFTLAKNSSAFPSANAAFEHGRELAQKPNLKCNQMLGTENGGEALYEQDMVDTLTKSFSAKVGISYPPCQLERDPFSLSTKTWLSPIKKMLNPIMKSKSQRNPPLMEREDTGVRTFDSASVRRNSMYCKFLSNDFLKATEKLEPIGRVIKRDQGSVSSSSPAHVQGTLRLHYKHGIPYSEFSTEVREDVLSAKAWRTDNAINWVYTFYSRKKRGNNIGSGKKVKKAQSFQMIGQMQVSSYLCLETSCNVTSNQSIVTEFTLYDIAQARRSFAVKERSQCSSDSIQPVDISAGDLVIGSPLEAKCSKEPANCQYPVSVRHALSEGDYDASSFYPWEPADLHSHLEIAAIVIQIPSNQKESTKNVEMNANITREHLNLSSVSTIDQIRGTISSNWIPANVKVVTPSGTHGLAATENGGPSSLLDRWRSGGGCDCGGWDMACPIFIFGNSSGVVADCPTMGSQPPVALFFQGIKEKTSALSISPDEGGLYSVHFHAQLSSLQAFSICIAILHSSETSPLVDQQSRQRLHSDLLRLPPREELRHKGSKKPKRNEPQRRESNRSIVVSS
ncbi:uncharacterized protein [Elaeis guineensis]